MDNKLTPKRRKFLEAYLKTWNASEAARQAGYKKEGSAGHFLLKIPEIQAALQERLREAGLSADEVVARLAEQAKLNAAEFFKFERDPATGELQMVDLNWEMVQKRGHLIKKLFWIKEKPVLEFHDAQTALLQLGRAHQIFVDKIDVDTHQDMIEVKLYIPDSGRDAQGTDNL